MFTVLPRLRKALRPLAALTAAALLSACDPTMVGGLGGSGASTGGPSIDASAPIPVALLVPKSDSGAGPVAVSLENAARLAIREQSGVQIDLRVYDTGGQSAQAAAQAQKAVDDGAKIILGPLFSEAANAAGAAVADEGVNVLSFSNTTAIAGGNVFILGPTFANTADRLMAHARKRGKKSIVIVYSDDVPGQFGKAAIEQAATANGIRVVSAEPYSLSVAGVSAAAQRAGATVKSGAADTVFITTDATNAAMPMLLNQLPENGVTPGQIQYVGLTRWDVRPDLFALPGAQGAWFAIPDTQRQEAFNQRYASTFGSAAHPLAGLAYDGISAIALLAKQGRSDALTGKSLTSSGFTGTGGVFRLLKDGTNERALAVATVQNNQMVILDPAPRNLSGAGF
ncbi:MAG: penicillin-binding protein activator [Sagittula sp.]|jgi:ABC-type branched-subunit amino acid transport system substrate-binding protein|uniref:penicillin-binding protein activator n=1 Tax=unclassified Sagittula TaxID=2624628 RepID=UPI000C2D3612|nr:MULTISPECIES: penicillin-binding protein activator [unclassified Sagittula]AUC53233.1 penicillin-binding protein activator [Sagittula sp. P11]WHZ34828.1 penicillin-binding protein activator [Sagittula sp. MA-2]